MAFLTKVLVTNICLLPFNVVCLSTGTTTASTSNTPHYSDTVYWNQYAAGQQLDQAAYESPKFWADLDKCIPSWQTSKEYGRFRGFCDNLRTEKPGKEIVTPNGQQLLAQYVFPGIDEISTSRQAYPAESFAELTQLQKRLSKDVQPLAKLELDSLLGAKPLVHDDETAKDVDNNDGDTWQRAAWYGWQFLSLRGAKRWMPKTTIALKNAMGTLGPAHRFVGLARQKHNCTGVLHSDGRNYMLSTLTPVKCPPGCGIVVDGTDAKLATDPVILDNTFLHYVYNHDMEQDRFCLMSECYHPSLTYKERDAIATLFAVKDRFTVVELELAPWGYDDDDLEMALKTGAVHDLNYWKEIGYDHAKTRLAQPKGFGATKATKRGFGK